MRSCTFADNSAAQGAALANAGTSVVVGNSLFDRSSGDQNVRNIAGTAGFVDSAGFNMSSDSSGPADVSDRLNTASLVSKTLSGAPEDVQYLSLPRNSPAVDAGRAEQAIDTREAARPFDIVGVNNAPGSDGSDIGAYESGDPAPDFRDQTLTIRANETRSVPLVASEPGGRPLSFTVATGASLPTGLSLSSEGMITVNEEAVFLGTTPVTIRATNTLGATTTAQVTFRIIEAGSLLVNTLGNDSSFDRNTTLNEAIDFAKSDGKDSMISFSETVFAAPRKTILLTGSAFIFNTGNKESIIAPTAGVELSGNGQDRIFAVASGTDLTLQGLTLRGGRADTGGAILNLGALLLDGCTLSGNNARDGGALYSNVAAAGQRTELRNCTLTGNSGGYLSGAIHNFNGELTLNSCTIAGNSAPLGSGVVSQGKDKTQTRVRNSIIAGNTGGGDVALLDGDFNSFESQGFNLIGTGDAVGAFMAQGDTMGANDAGLGALNENGGRVPTSLPQSGSPAIDTGDTDLPTDARGIVRPRGRADDRGAVESASAITIAVSLTPQNPFTNDTLTAKITASDAGDDAVYSYVWKNNGVVLPNETDSLLQLFKSGNGDKGDVITLEVTVADAQGGRDQTSARATVQNSAPIAISSQGTVDVATEKGFVLNAFDADGDALTFKRVGGPRNGVTADIRVDPADGKLKLFYKSRPKYGGVDIIRFVAFDSDNKQSNESTLGIRVLYTPPPPANRAPIAGDTNIDTYVGVSEIKGLLGSDPDGDAITFRIVNNAKYGSSEIKRDTDGKFKLFYTSLNRFYGPDRVTYVVTDSRGADSNLATVNINFTNRAPVAQGNKIGVASGVEVSQYLFGTDADGDALTFRLVNNPRYGKGEVKLDPQGKWRFYYTSLPGYVGPDQITFIAIDPMGKESSVAAIDINVVRVSGSSVAGALQRGVAPSSGAS